MEKGYSEYGYRGLEEIKRLNKIIEDLYYEEEKLIDTSSDGFISLDVRSYDRICKYLKKKSITVMGIT